MNGGKKYLYYFKNGYRLVTPYLYTVSHRVKHAWAEREVQDVLAEYWSFLPSEEIQSAFPNKRVFVNGLLAKPEMILSQQDTLGLLIHRHEPEVLDRPLDVVHVSPGMVVINKPSSVPVVPVGRFRMNTVLKILINEYPELLKDGKQLNIVHRIDRLASGLLILSRSPAASTKLVTLFKKRLVAKEYIARVKGVFPEGTTRVYQPIGRIQHDSHVFGVSPEGKEALTVFEREGVTPDGTQSLVRCRPVTGRTHQIRVHLQWLGFPIANDWKYGGHFDNSQSLSPVPDPIDYTKVVWCKECEQGTRDKTSVSLPDLSVHSIWLHSLRYTSTHPSYHWTFETPKPSWALL